MSNTDKLSIIVLILMTIISFCSWRGFKGYDENKKEKYLNIAYLSLGFLCIVVFVAILFYKRIFK